MLRTCSCNLEEIKYEVVGDYSEEEITGARVHDRLEIWKSIRRRSRIEQQLLAGGTVYWADSLATESYMIHFSVLELISQHCTIATTGRDWLQTL